MARRAGGRRARKALREAPLAEATKPVRPGETGGSYLPLTEAGLSKVVDNAFRMAAEIGFDRCHRSLHRCLYRCRRSARRRRPPPHATNNIGVGHGAS